MVHRNCWFILLLLKDIGKTISPCKSLSLAAYLVVLSNLSYGYNLFLANDRNRKSISNWEVCTANESIKVNDLPD